ncbi:hypothetical protein KQI41_10855 [Tissierella pigra]|uniref:hypothetical protein n=1 Tax=Tissierella pigra TaxID=2607614 RepID=UPI001C100582|nr:hypothetical protein [Tissierella pigra]MBU5426910.1 hypothetical protein [Tissierella pigra]
MKSKRVFSIMFIFALLLSFSSSQIFAQNVADKDNISIISDYADGNEHKNDVHEENGLGIVVFSEEGETVLELIIDVPDFKEKSIPEIVGKMISEKLEKGNYQDSNHQLDNNESARIITCCDRTSWKRYLMEVHSRTSPTCYVDVYDFFICDNCDASYREYKNSYSHPRANCPY